MKLYISIITLLLFINISYSQKSCFFSQQDDFEDKNNEYKYGNLDFFVNGKLIDNSKLKNRIFINESGLDSIRVLNNYDNSSYLIFCKLKNNEKYHINYNVCSAFEIIPKSNDASYFWKGDELVLINKRASQNNFIRLIKRGNEKELFVVEGSWVVEKSDYKNNDTTSYYRYFSSAYCPHAQSRIIICNTDEKPENKFLRDTSICLTIRIMFFYSEKYSIIYNGNSNDISLRFDGYFDEQKDKTINANNSIYIAD